jgi:hypothetical protein
MNSARTAAAIITRGIAMMQYSQGRLFFVFPWVIRPSLPNLLFQIHFSPYIFKLYQILNIKPVLHLVSISPRQKLPAPAAREHPLLTPPRGGCFFDFRFLVDSDISTRKEMGKKRVSLKKLRYILRYVEIFKIKKHLKTIRYAIYFMDATPFKGPIWTGVV